MPGDTVNFTITVDNDGNNDLNSLVVYDNLLDSNGKTVSSQISNVGTMLSLQESTISFPLTIAATAVPGNYSNSAYAKALNGSLQEVNSQATAVSWFIVGTGNSGQQQQSNQSNQQNTNNKPDVTVVNRNLSSKSASSPSLSVGNSAAGQVLGAACVQASFTVNLQQGSNNKDVKALQVYLNKNGFALAKKGAGSPGFETSAFGPLLKAALTKFQIVNGIKERGVFGTETRTFLNNLLNTSGEAFCLPPAPLSKVKPKLPAITIKTPTLKPVKPLVIKTPRPVTVKTPPPKPSAAKKSSNIFSKILNPLAFWP